MLKIHKTKIPGLLLVNLDVFEDERGWFKESFQKAKLVDLGLPRDFVPVQNNVSFNKQRGVTRGIHAEPWNKYISLAKGLVFAAIVDLRRGKNFGVFETFELTPNNALYVPAGCGNSLQTLSDDVVYSYLVDAHWSPNAKYVMVNLSDEKLAIDWPIPLDKAIISDKDKKHPRLAEVNPMEL